MPFTPFHFGPGLLAKGLAPERFSWTAFAAAQVVIDCETLYHMLAHHHPVHRELHTFLGATLAGAATSLAVLACRRPAQDRLKDRSPAVRAEFSVPAVWAGGLIGGASHPFLDGLMHSDIRPFLPWTDANPLLGLVSLSALHLGCLAVGLIGACLFYRRTGP